MIKLNDLFKIANTKEYKIHFANIAGSHHPLDEWESCPENFEEWQSWQSKRNFDCKYVLSLIDFKDRGYFMFAGIYEVLGCEGDVSVEWTDKKYYKYKTRLTEMYSEYIGRLIVECKRDRASYCYLETYIDKCSVIKILEQKHTIEHFCGYQNINHSFEKISNIIKKSPKDWQVALSNMKGVYLLIDDSNNKKYIGSASGEFGIWSRWSNYINNYTGGNKGLDDLHKQVGEEHFKKNFRFILLEYFTDKTDDNYVLGRESFWKKALNSRQECGYGYNHN